MHLSLTLLTRSDAFYTSKRLLEAARARGITTSWVDSGASAEEALSHLRSHGGALPDLVLPRIGSQYTDQELNLLRALIAKGIFSPSSPASLRAAMDKAETYTSLRRSDVPVIPSRLATSWPKARDAAHSLGPGPWVLKPRFGSLGRDVQMAGTEAELQMTFEEIASRNTDVIVQPFVTLNPPRELRVLVIGGVARTACWRIAPAGEFRSNVHLGASTEPATLEPEVAQLACDATRALGLDYAGVDLLPPSTEPNAEAANYRVLELNGSPGLEGIEAATGLDLASDIIDWALRAHSERAATSSQAPGVSRSEPSSSSSPRSSRP